jgi:hypothetical protein
MFGSGPERRSGAGANFKATASVAGRFNEDAPMIQPREYTKRTIGSIGSDHSLSIPVID